MRKSNAHLVLRVVILCVHDNTRDIALLQHRYNDQTASGNPVALTYKYSAILPELHENCTEN